MAAYQVLYWKHIPAQVRVFEEGKKPISRLLSDRFQIEIDKLAVETGLTGADDYINQWRWTPKLQRPGTAEEVASALVRELKEQTTFGNTDDGSPES